MKKYMISINGQSAVDNARKILGCKCYKAININGVFATQMEIVLDEEGSYNGKPLKWVDFSFIPSAMVENVIAWLRENGFSGHYAFIAEEIGDGEIFNEEPISI